MIRAGLIALALLVAVACGKYGPPVRGPADPTAAQPAVSASPAAGDTEECPDPNAPGQAATRAP